uniref:Micro-fibrillar-associated protein 1 C-terminal domain-containing protein n=2 Tax=Oryza TaxID=4527 RepID=A0A0D3GG49_9ORYZ
MGRTRRRRIRERLLLLEREKEELPAQQQEEKLPIFIHKTQRVTITERKRIEDVARQLEEVLMKRIKKRKIETRQIVVEEIRNELRINKIINSEESDIEIEVNTDDEENKAEEYEAWTNREIARTKRGKEEREAMLRP